MIKLKNIVVIIKIKGVKALEKEETQIRIIYQLVFYEQERHQLSNLRLLERQIELLIY